MTVDHLFDSSPQGAFAISGAKSTDDASLRKRLRKWLEGLNEILSFLTWPVVFPVRQQRFWLIATVSLSPSSLLTCRGGKAKATLLPRHKHEIQNLQAAEFLAAKVRIPRGTADLHVHPFCTRSKGTKRHDALEMSTVFVPKNSCILMPRMQAGPAFGSDTFTQHFILITNGK